MTEWRKRPAHRTDGDTLLLSVVFTWQLPLAAEEVRAARFLGYPIRVGGPAVRLMPDFLPPEVVDLSDDGDWLSRHNPDATRTSAGCPRGCSFCAVPKLHPEQREITDFRPAPLVCDDNFLACSEKHIRRSVDRLRGVHDVDFNQGLDARLLKPWHLDLLTSLDLGPVRFAWDSAGCEKPTMRAVSASVAAGIPKRSIRVYILIGYGETPEEALYRHETVKATGAYPVPMRYQPLDSLTKNSHLPPEWSRNEMARFVKYWSRQAWYRGIDYADFVWGA